MCGARADVGCPLLFSPRVARAKLNQDNLGKQAFLQWSNLAVPVTHRIVEHARVCCAAYPMSNVHSSVANADNAQVGVGYSQADMAEEPKEMKTTMSILMGRFDAWKRRAGRLADRS